MIARRTARALGVLTDPNGAADPARCGRLHATDIAALCDAADAHSVLPAVVANLNRYADRICPTLVGDPLAEALAPARDLLRKRTAVCLILRAQLAEIVDAFGPRDLPVMVLKGPAFADRLYSEPGLRTFTDLDLLIARDTGDDAAAAMRELGYSPLAEGGRKHYAEYGEQSWRRDRSGGDVEIHWNVVNSPTLRAGVSVEYADLVSNGKVSPAALMVVAAAHGATSHQFDRLGLLWDMAQAARGVAGEVDPDELSEIVRRTGCTRAMAMGLHLVTTVLGERRGGELRRRAKLPVPPILDRLSLTRSVVLGRAPLVRARRLAFRQRLKRP